MSVLDSDPDLGEGLPPEELASAREHAIARVARYQKGPWAIGPDAFDGTGSLGLLLIQGLLVRKVTVGQRTCAELLGPGDMTQPWLQARFLGRDRGQLPPVELRRLHEQAAGHERAVQGEVDRT